MKYQNKGLGFINAMILSELIQKDINNGVYIPFEWLEKRLQHIADRLIQIHYLCNGELNQIELKLLCENEYIIQY